jgi:pimeloyl-ACP methyl ester carboxylesterase
MTSLRSNLKIAVVAVILIFSVLSCTKDTTTPSYTNFVSKEVALQLTQEYMSGLIDLASESNPELSAIKPLIVTDVTVYKVVYKTTVDNQEIEASGLVCVPASAGNYPVLSFQNGTNTVNAGAPSMLPSDYSYEMIELIASLGYVVVIADYPGFGSSSTIPHPYLIKEPTVRSIVDMLYSVREFVPGLAGIKLLNEYYLLGYSQGGWATLALHKALEQDYNSDFDLKGSACGAGPYDLYLLMQGMVDVPVYPMPVYLGYIVNAYTAYNQITNPVSDIFNEPYASRISTLYNGMLTSSEINGQLTTSVPDLLNPGFLAGFDTAPEYSSVRYALDNNSVSAWHTYKPLLLLHGSDDTDVNPISTENMYSELLAAGTSADIVTKVIIPGANHSGGIVPSILQGVLFLNNIKNTK